MLAPRPILAMLLVTVGLTGTLAGCKLIDQTTFAPDPEPDQVAAPPVAPGPRPAGMAPIMTIRFETTSPDYQDALTQAVQTVEQRRPGAMFEVVATSSATEAAQATTDATSVMKAMREMGVPITRMTLGARVDPTLSVREVRIYLR